MVESLYKTSDCTSSSFYSTVSSGVNRMACQPIKTPDGSVQVYHKVTCTDQCANVNCGAYGTCGRKGRCTCSSGYTGATCNIPPASTPTPTPTPTPTLSSGGSGRLSGTIFSDRTCSSTTNNIVFTDWSGECTPIGDSFLRMTMSCASTTFSIRQYDDSGCTRETANQGNLAGQYCRAECAAPDDQLSQRTESHSIVSLLFQARSTATAWHRSAGSLLPLRSRERAPAPLLPVRLCRPFSSHWRRSYRPPCDDCSEPSSHLRTTAGVQPLSPSLSCLST